MENNKVSKLEELQAKHMQKLRHEECELEKQQAKIQYQLGILVGLEACEEIISEMEKLFKYAEVCG